MSITLVQFENYTSSAEKSESSWFDCPAISSLSSLNYTKIRITIRDNCIIQCNYMCPYRRINFNQKLGHHIRVKVILFYFLKKKKKRNAYL